ncbi:MAG TPA: hypothetical protein VES58_04885 [Syntrophobacteria bacterium]|nr:hypothetical protein [Syntrophobacteria bacterium]
MNPYRARLKRPGSQGERRATSGRGSTGTPDASLPGIVENKTAHQRERAEQGVRLERLVVSTPAGVAHEQPDKGKTATGVMINERQEEFKPALCTSHLAATADMAVLLSKL